MEDDEQIDTQDDGDDRYRTFFCRTDHRLDIGSGTHLKMRRWVPPHQSSVPEGARGPASAAALLFLMRCPYTRPNTQAPKSAVPIAMLRVASRSTLRRWLESPAFSQCITSVR